MLCISACHDSVVNLHAYCFHQICCFTLHCIACSVVVGVTCGMCWYRIWHKRPCWIPAQTAIYSQWHCSSIHITCKPVGYSTVLRQQSLALYTVTAIQSQWHHSSASKRFVLTVQVENVKKGFPYIMFGDGHLASCKPISEADLASFMADCVEDKDKVNQVLPIGGNSFSPNVSLAGNSQVTLGLCALR